MDEEELFTYIDSDEFIERYVDEFRSGLDSDTLSTYDFDKMLLAKGGTEDRPDEIVWGAVQNFSKHMALISEVKTRSEPVKEIQTYLQRLNANPSKQTINAFLVYLEKNYSSITTLTANRLIEIPDPTVPKMGDYPVVDVILYAPPDEKVMKSVQATRYSSSFSVDDADSVFDHVSEKIPSGGVKRYAEDVYQATVQGFEEALTANLVPDLDKATLERAGYTKLKDEAIPSEVNRLHADKSATYWQKEIWKVDGVDATTGFARVWLAKEEEVGIVQPSAGDFDADHAVHRMITELRGDTSS